MSKKSSFMGPKEQNDMRRYTKWNNNCFPSINISSCLMGFQTSCSTCFGFQTSCLLACLLSLVLHSASCLLSSLFSCRKQVANLALGNFFHLLHVSNKLACFHLLWISNRLLHSAETSKYHSQFSGNFSKPQAWQSFSAFKVMFGVLGSKPRMHWPRCVMLCGFMCLKTTGQRIPDVQKLEREREAQGKGEGKVAWKAQSWWKGGRESGVVEKDFLRSLRQRPRHHQKVVYKKAN